MSHIPCSVLVNFSSTHNFQYSNANLVTQANLALFGNGGGNFECDLLFLLESCIAFVVLFIA